MKKLTEAEKNTKETVMTLILEDLKVKDDGSEELKTIYTSEEWAKKVRLSAEKIKKDLKSTFLGVKFNIKLRARVNYIEIEVIIVSKKYTNIVLNNVKTIKDYKILCKSWDAQKVMPVIKIVKEVEDFFKKI